MQEFIAPVLATSPVEGDGVSAGATSFVSPLRRGASLLDQWFPN